MSDMFEIMETIENEFGCDCKMSDCDTISVAEIDFTYDMVELIEDKFDVNIEVECSHDGCTWADMVIDM